VAGSPVAALKYRSVVSLLPVKNQAKLADRPILFVAVARVVVSPAFRCRCGASDSLVAFGLKTSLDRNGQKTRTKFVCWC
jgi:hypothetical protein